MMYRIAHVLFNIVNFFWFRLKVIGKENIPKKGGRAVVCPNHTYWYDPLLVDTIFPAAHPPHWMAKAEIFSNWFNRWILKEMHVFPVDRHHVSVATLKTAMGYLRADKALGIFPEGTRVHKGEHVKPADGFIVFALKTRSPIIPVYIDATYKFRSRTTVIIGKPISLTAYYGKKVNSKETRALAEKILAEIYALKDEEKTD